jgi:hypothetical protein
MTTYRQWIFSVAVAIVFGAPAIAQQPQIKYYVVANATPPDAFLALRTHPSSKIGRRIETMANGTVLEVLKTNSDGWWYVKIVASGTEGWALSGQEDKHWIVCCVARPTIPASPVPKPMTRPTPPPHRLSSSSPPISSGPVILDLTSDGLVFNPEAIVNRCLRETGAMPGIMNAPGGAELLKCIEREQTEQAAQLGDRACNDHVCIYRLKEVAENTFAGSGYIIKHRVSSKPAKFGNQDLINYESILTRDDGKRAVMSQTVGPVGSIFFAPASSRPKSEITATYYGPISIEKNNFVVLRVPQVRVESDEDKNAPAVFLPCQNAPTDTIPCALKWKMVEVKYETLGRFGSFRADGTESTALQNRRDLRSEGRAKIIFGNNEDVYVFSDRAAGYVFKVNLEIDFLANRSRAPKDAFPPCVKSNRGRLDFHDNILALNVAIESVCDWSSSLTRLLKIKFAPDFASCEVVEFSLVDKRVNPNGSSYLLDTYKFQKTLECRMHSAR